MLTNGLSGGNGTKILKIGTTDPSGSNRRGYASNQELTEEHVFLQDTRKELDTILPHELED